MQILLFDIDGTLLITDGGGKGAFELAIRDEFGVENAKTDINFAGRTDRSLLAELLERNGVSANDENQHRLLRRYIDYFPEVLAQRGGRVLPGVMDLLDRLSTQSESLCYVMTGNLTATATRKLDHFGLRGFFRGIFGGDHDTHRDALARRTAASIRDEHGDQALRNLIVIGDTPHDVRCGHAIGARVVAVCTGGFGRADLEAENPTSVHDDLTDVSAIVARLSES